MQRCSSDDELMPITTSDHLKSPGNRTRLIVISYSELDPNDWERAMREYGPIVKIEFTADNCAAFVDFACEHAPLLVARCAILREYIPEMMIPKGVDALLPGCSMDNFLYLQHVPRLMSNEDIRQFFNLHKESVIYRTGTAQNPSSRVVIGLHGKKAETYAPQKDLLKLYYPKGRYGGTNFYAIPEIPALTEWSRVYNITSCKVCYFDKIRGMIAHADRISATGMPVPPNIHTPAPLAPLADYASSSVLDFPSILDPSERARWGIKSEEAIVSTPAAAPPETQPPLTQLQTRKGVSLRAQLMQSDYSPSKRAERIRLLAQDDEEVLFHMNKFEELFAAGPENNFGYGDTSRASSTPPRSPTAALPPPASDLVDQELPKQFLQRWYTWVARRLVEVVRRAREEGRGVEVSSEPPAAAGAQSGTGASSSAPTAARNEEGSRTKHQFSGMLFGKGGSHAARPSARDAPVTARDAAVTARVARDAPVTARGAPVTARGAPVAAREAPESEEERDTPTPNRIIWEDSREPSPNGNDDIVDGSEGAMRVVDNGLRRPTREDAAVEESQQPMGTGFGIGRSTREDTMVREPERAIVGTGFGFGRTMGEDATVGESKQEFCNGGFGFGFGKTTGECATFREPSPRPSTNVFLTPSLPRLDADPTPLVLSTSVMRVVEPSAVDVEKKWRSGSAAATQAPAPAQMRLAAMADPADHSTEFSDSGSRLCPSASPTPSHRAHSFDALQPPPQLLHPVGHAYGDVRPPYTPPLHIPSLMSLSLDAPPKQEPTGFGGFGGSRPHSGFGSTPASPLPQTVSNPVPVGFGFGRGPGPTPSPSSLLPPSFDGYDTQVVPKQEPTGFGFGLGPSPSPSPSSFISPAIDGFAPPVVPTPEPTGFGFGRDSRPPSSIAASCPPPPAPFPVPISADGYAPQVVPKPLKRKEKEEEPTDPERYSTTDSLSSSSVVSEDEEERQEEEEELDSDDLLPGQEDRKLWRSGIPLPIRYRTVSSSSNDTLDSDDLLPGQEDLKQWKSGAPDITFPRRSSSRSTVPESGEKEEESYGRNEDVAGDDSSNEEGAVSDRSRSLTDGSGYSASLSSSATVPHDDTVVSRDGTFESIDYDTVSDLSSGDTVCFSDIVEVPFNSPIDGRETAEEEEDMMEVEQKEDVVPPSSITVDQEETRNRGSSAYFEWLTREVAAARDSEVRGVWHGPRPSTVPMTRGRGIESKKEDETTVAATVSQGARDSPSADQPFAPRRNALGRVVPTFGAKLGKPNNT